MNTDTEKTLNRRKRRKRTETQIPQINTNYERKWSEATTRELLRMGGGETGSQRPTGLGSIYDTQA